MEPFNASTFPKDRPFREILALVPEGHGLELHPQTLGSFNMWRVVFEEVSYTIERGPAFTTYKLHLDGSAHVVRLYPVFSHEQWGSL